MANIGSYGVTIVVHSIAALGTQYSILARSTSDAKPTVQDYYPFPYQTGDLFISECPGGEGFCSRAIRESTAPVLGGPSSRPIALWGISSRHASSQSQSISNSAPQR